MFSEQQYPSEIADNGKISWQIVKTNPDGSVGPLEYPNVTWENSRTPFGWTVLNHRTYFRGIIHVYRAGVYLVKMNNVISYKIDHYAHAGNPYSYDHATETSIYLSEGPHKLYVCTSYDVRIHGGSIPPKITFTGSFRALDDIDPNYGMIAHVEDSILPEIMNGVLISPYASISVRNGVVQPLDNESESDNIQNGWKMVDKIFVIDSDGNEIPTNVLTLNTLNLAPGQIYPIPFKFDNPRTPFPESIKIIASIFDETGKSFSLNLGLFMLSARTWGVEAFKITHLGFDFSVQYGILLKIKS